MTIIDISSERERRETEVWDCYIQARRRAEESESIEDGRIAARAWCAFIDLYLTPSQSAFMGGTVKTFGRRA